MYPIYLVLVEILRNKNLCVEMCLLKLFNFISQHCRVGLNYFLRLYIPRLRSEFNPCRRNRVIGRGKALAHIPASYPMLAI